MPRGLAAEIDDAGLNGCKCGAGARITLPTWVFPVGEEMEPIWSGLIGMLEKWVDAW